MKIKCSIFLFVAFTSIHIQLRAQINTDYWIRRSELIKDQYSENSTQYLTALDSVICYAAKHMQMDTLSCYQQKHLALTATRYGTNSVEYADDLVRMGYTCYRNHVMDYQKLLSQGMSYFLQAGSIFKHVNMQEAPEYWNTIMPEFLLGYQMMLGEDQAAPFCRLYTEMVKNEYGETSSEYFISCFHMARLSRHIDQDFQYYYNQMLDIIDTTPLTTSENIYLKIMDLQQEYAMMKEDYSILLSTASYFLPKIMDRYGENSAEYAESLFHTGYNYVMRRSLWKYSSQHDNLEQRSRDLLLQSKEIFEKVYQNIDSLYAQDSYINALSLLSHMTLDLDKQIECEQKIVEILKYKGSTDTEEYFQHLERLYMYMIIDKQFPVAISIIPELEQLILHGNHSHTSLYGTYNDDCIHFQGHMCQDYNPSSAYHLYNGACRLYTIVGNYDLALTYESKFQEFSDAPRYDLMGQYLAFCYQKEQAKEAFDKARHDRMQLNEEDSFFTTAIENADFLRFAGIKDRHGLMQLNQAIAKARSVQKKSNHKQQDTDKTSELYIKLLITRGMWYFETGNMNRAYKDFQQAINLEQDKEFSTPDELILLNHLVLCKIMMNQSKESNNILSNLPKTYFDTETDAIVYANYLMCTALYYQSISDLENALSNWKSAAECLVKIDGINNVRYVACWCNMAQLFIKQKQYSKADLYLNLCYRFYDERTDVESKIMKARVCRLMAYLYDLLGNNQKAQIATNEFNDLVSKMENELADYGNSSLFSKNNRDLNALQEALFDPNSLVLYHLDKCYHPQIPICLRMATIIL